MKPGIPCHVKTIDIYAFGSLTGIDPSPYWGHASGKNISAPWCAFSGGIWWDSLKILLSFRVCLHQCPIQGSVLLGS